MTHTLHVQGQCFPQSVLHVHDVSELKEHEIHELKSTTIQYMAFRALKNH